MKFQKIFFGARFDIEIEKTLLTFAILIGMISNKASHVDYDEKHPP